MSSDIERWEPPNDAKAFESLCLDLWKDIWRDSGVQKHGRSGQKQAGVDVFGHADGRLVGVQCKQKDGRLWAKVTEAELEAEVQAARRFVPKLTKFILATTAPRDAALQRKANQLTEQHRQQQIFSVEVWAWEDLWHELYRRYDLLSRIAHIYWPLRTSLPPRPPTLADLVRDARAYLEYIAPQCQRLPLIGLDPKGKDTPLTLDAVYTALDTKTTLSIAGMTPPPLSNFPLITALAAVTRHACLVLKGDPGSGKSTFISYLSLCLAKHHLEPDGNWLARLTDWPADARPIPFTIVLRDFVRTQPAALPVPCPDCLWKFFAKWLADNRLSTCANALETALNLGHAIVFLDGLDEVPTDAQREFVRACALVFAERFRHSRLVLTCRTIPYQAMLQAEAKELAAHPRPGLRLAEVPDFELAPFDDDKITAFIAAWYAGHVPKPFSREVAEDRRRALAQAVQRPELRRLAGNPMLLTDMALLHTHRGRLPDDRAKLYKEIIELLLLRWEETKEGSRLQDLLRDAKRDEHDLLRTLGAVAFAVHGRCRNLKPDETGDIQLHELLFALQELHPQKSLDWASRVIETIQDRAGLLIAVDKTVFRFPHRSFQECLAALHLLKDRPAWNQLVDLLDETGYWREVIKWAAGRIAHVDDNADEKGLNLLRRLCPTDAPPERLPWHRVWLAGEVLLEMSLAKVEQFKDEGGPALATRIRGLLQQLLAAEALTPFERAQAGMTLGLLGDGRPGVGTCPRPGQKDRPDLRWTPVIQPDDFIMGGPGEYEGKLRFKHRLAHPFCIAVHPITVAQFELFIQDGGYGRKELWTEAGWAWREQEQRTRPDDYDSAFQTPNHARVGVSWYEAVAFCQWLQATFKAEDFELPDGWQVRLPSEAEWERAARHTDGRAYPWGNATDDVPQRCNMDDTGIGHTNAVGLFPSGQAECGALDMAGNVFEWTRSLWGKDWQKADFNYPYEAKDGRENQSAPRDTLRVLRGGAWGSYADFARCAYRGQGGPDPRSGSVGFRLVASPFPSAL